MNPPSHDRPSSSALESGPDTEVTHPLMEEATRLAELLAANWRRGHPCPAEDLLAGHASILAFPQAALRVVYEEVCQRQELGQEVSLTELGQRFPQWRDQLGVLFDCVRLLGMTPRATRFPTVGETLGEFRLLAVVGRGGRGRVYLAEHTFLAGRLAILKFIPLGDQEHLKLARVQHTHIVPLYSVRDFLDRNLRQLVLPCLGGTSLAHLLDQLSEIPPEKRTGRDLLGALRAGVADARLYWPAQGPNLRFLERASYVQAICWMGVCLADALHFAHEQGLVHLDVKPSNVLLTADCQPMLLDFHLAQEAIPAGREVPDWLGGTQGYMSPEQQAALRACHEQRPLTVGVDGRSDIYSLGLLLREALYGELEDHSLLRAHELPPRADLSTGLRDVLARCLCPDPSARYPNAAQVAEDLRRHLTDHPLLGVRNRNLAERWHKWRRRRPQALLWTLLIAGCLAVAVALGVRTFGESSARQRAAQKALDQGRQLAEEHHYAEAVYTFDRGLERAGGTSVDADDLDETAAYFDRATEQRPQDFWAWHGKGVCAYRRNRPDEAVTAFSVCVALSPDSAACYHNRGLALAAHGDNAAALRDYDRALTLDPHLAGAALNRGVLQFQQRHYTEAESDFRLALELGAQPAAVHYNWALLHQARQEPAAALASVERALQADPDHRPSRELRDRLAKQLSSPNSAPR